MLGDFTSLQSQLNLNLNLRDKSLPLPLFKLLAQMNVKMIIMPESILEETDDHKMTTRSLTESDYSEIKKMFNKSTTLLH